MSDSMSSSVDSFIDIDGDEAVNDPDIDSSAAKKIDSFIDSRRRLEDRLAERQLQRDLREFDFDL